MFYGFAHMKSHEHTNPDGTKIQIRRLILDYMQDYDGRRFRMEGKGDNRRKVYLEDEE